MLLTLVLALLAQPLYLIAMPPEWNLPSMPTSWALPFGSSHRCVPIPSTMQLCDKIGYREMRLPNMLNHDTVNEVMEQTKHWVPLANLACHKEIRVLLCSIYAPVCIPQLLERQIKPCRTLCEAVMRPCAAVMQKFGYAWPEILNCEQFPPETDHMCIKATQRTDCDACPNNVTYESVIGNYCVNNVAFKARVDSITKESGGFRIRLKRRVRFFKSTGVSRRQKRSIRSVFIQEDSSGCACGTLEAARNDSSKRFLMMGSVSPDGTSFSVTFLAEWQQRDRRFKWAIRKIRGSRRRSRAGEISATSAGSAGTNSSESICTLSQLNEPIPTSTSLGRRGGRGNRRKRKNRRRKKNNDRRRRNRKTSRSDSTAAASDRAPARDGGTSAAADRPGRRRRQRRNRDNDSRDRRGYAYDKSYYKNYQKS
ncbi:hypothetical protein BOX15_Mlig013305g1 [Macrostomum lignano]|uniref:Secreted frizzled-related protein n=3 Tax=Macrostomum lignano TaxID=282301 RepID=A0A1I8G1L5_9PLAT|nr:hypothetical protein BOX15_Mlig013305g1 [Macrostomum lignano]